MMLTRGGQHDIELGCGKRKALPELIGIDCQPFESADIVADLEQTPWRWAEDESCRLVVCHQTLEHIQRLLPVMAEIWRICDEEAYVEIVVPYGAGKPAIQDPTHVRFFTEETFRYWEPHYCNGWGDYGIQRHFAICGQDWRENANLWVLLKPLRTEEQVEIWLAVRRDSPGGIVTWPAPSWLLDRRNLLLGQVTGFGPHRPGVPLDRLGVPDV